MPRCLVSFGANIGNPAETIRDAALSLEKRIGGRERCSFRLSRFFKTPPVGGPTGQPPFVNAVAAIESSQSVWELWADVRAVETEFGRERNLRWEARKLDLDILLYDDARIWTPQFKVPHPRMCMRRFILEPACDVAADWLDPVSGMTLAELAVNLKQQPVCVDLWHDSSVAGLRIATAVAEESGALLRSSGDGGSGPLTAARELRLRRLPPPTIAGSEVELAAPSRSHGLVVYLPPAIGKRLGAWEDIHRDAAIVLNLHEADSPAVWNINLPRYLLASDDESWAIHELNAAYEAMDCPVEAIS